MIVTAILGLLIAVNAPIDRAVIARVDGRAIVRSSCAPEISHKECVADDQARLERFARTMLIDAAARLHGVNVSEAEVQAQAVVVSDATLRSANEHLKRIAAAALRVREGEKKDAVYRRDLQPHGVTPDQFDAALRLYATAQKAREGLAIDVTADVRTQMVEQARRRILLERLSTLVDGSEDRFWQDVIRRTDSTVVDPQFHLPDMKGVLRDVPHH